MPNNADRVLDYLRLIAPRRATNEEILARTGIRPHAQVFQITKRLVDEKVVRAIRSGREWEFWVERKGDSRPRQMPRSAVHSPESDALASAFEQAACESLSNHFGRALARGTIAGVPKTFDFVSDDGAIVGDAKFYVLGQTPPSAKFATIAEYVWLLEKTAAPTKFLVFGNDRRVPEQWLRRYRNLVDGISFFFLATDGKLDQLH